MLMRFLKAKTTNAMNMATKYPLSQPKTATSWLALSVIRKTSMIQIILPDAIKQANSNRTKPIKQAVCDRSYRGVKQVGDTDIILSSKALKKGQSLSKRQETQIV